MIEWFKSINISYGTWLFVAIVIIGALILTRAVRWAIDKFMNTATDKLDVDPTRYKFFKNAASFIIWIFALATIVYTIPKLKTLAITLFAGAGILVAIIGFAAQQAFSNIVSGIFIVLYKPFRVGDLIRVGPEEYGIVEDITLRHTVIISFENKRIIIPNSNISAQTVINDSIDDAKVCRFIEVGISYDSDVDLAIGIMRDIAENHPLCIDVRTAEEKQKGTPKVIVRLYEFGDFSLKLRAFVWTKDPLQAREMHSDINREIKKRFEQEGVEIPFPYRTIVYKNDLKKPATKDG